MPNIVVPPQQPPFIQPGFAGPPLQRSNKDSPQRQNRRRRRQLNIPPNVNFQQQQPIIPIQQQQQILPFQQQQQILPIQQQQQQPILPIQQQQQQPILPIQQQQPILPIQQQQPILPIQQQQLNPTLNPSYYQMPAFPTSAIFQDGQFYPTMDPQFSIQAQISAGPTGNGI